MPRPRSRDGRDAARAARTSFSRKGFLPRRDSRGKGSEDDAGPRGTVIARESTRFSAEAPPPRVSTSRSPRPAAAELPADERRLRFAMLLPPLQLCFARSLTPPFSPRAPFPSAASSFFPLNLLSRAPRDSASAAVSCLLCSCSSAFSVSSSSSSASSLARSSYPSSEVRIVRRARNAGNGRLR